MAKTGEVLCGEAKAFCSCKEPAGHDTDHGCACGGRWDHEGIPTRLPGIFGAWADDEPTDALVETPAPAGTWYPVTTETLVDALGFQSSIRHRERDR